MLYYHRQKEESYPVEKQIHTKRNGTDRDVTPCIMLAYMKDGVQESVKITVIIVKARIKLYDKQHKSREGEEHVYND